jgi:hypothetical protein
MLFNYWQYVHYDYFCFSIPPIDSRWPFYLIQRLISYTHHAYMHTFTETLHDRLIEKNIYRLCMDIIKPYHPRSQSPSNTRVGIFLERSNSSCHMTSPRCLPKGVSASIGCELHQIPQWYFSNRAFSVHHRMHMPLRAFFKTHAALLPPGCLHTHT